VTAHSAYLLRTMGEDQWRSVLAGVFGGLLVLWIVLAVGLRLLLRYLALPFDLIPDVVPVVGYADDAIVVVLTLRSVIRSSGVAAVERHWPGTADGLTVVRRLSGL